MLKSLNNRLGHYLLLIAVWAVLSLINLGKPGLWDIDESNNAEAARVMLVSGNWVVPYFNGELRTDKPALLYWCQILCYQTFGVNELAARFPSAIVALLTVLLVYELGRMMLGAAVGLMSGLILGSGLLFTGSAHFANPDALLHLCTVLTLFLFWRDYSQGRSTWLLWTGISSGLGMLAKGPVGLVLPSGVITFFLLWNRDLKAWFRPWLLGGIFVFILVAIPWYAYVGAETKGKFLYGFFLKHNVSRFSDTMENHRGFFLIYYPLVLCVGFAPWSIFFLMTGWHGWKRRQERKALSENSPDLIYRFLGCWIATYVIFFSISATKLPNYILPMYAPLSILIAHFLVRWRRGECHPPKWMVHVSLASLILTGVGIGFGSLVGGGALGAAWTKGRHLPGLEHWAFLGLIPIACGLLGWWLLQRENRRAFISAVATCAVVLTSTMAAWGSLTVDQYKCSRPLAEILRKEMAPGEIRVGAFDYFQPSLVFYCQREVEVLYGEENALSFLEYPIPVYLFTPASRLESLREKSLANGVQVRELGRHYALYRGLEVVLITNR